MITTKFNGLERIINKLSPELLNEPLREFFGMATIFLQNSARERAPVDTGQLRNSIAIEIDPMTPPLWGKVGTNLAAKAKAMEFGTGLRSQAPDSKGGRHFPPWGDQNPELELWARRHGFPNGFVVARAIARKGGLKPRRYLRDAFLTNIGVIREMVAQLGVLVASRWGNG